jgi:hypothetical protein
MQLHPDAIFIPDNRLRKVKPEAVATLAKSISELGLQVPIDVRMGRNGYTLVAGAHRLAAVKALGLPRIECRQIVANATASEIWEVAENLHREELTPAERDRQIRRYAELTQKLVDDVNTQRQRNPNRGGRGKKGPVTQVAEALNISKDMARRALRDKPNDKPNRPNGLGAKQSPKQPTDPVTGKVYKRGEVYRIIMEICTMGKGSCTPEQVAEALGIEPANAEQHMREVAKLGFHQWQGRTLMYASPPMDALRTLFPQFAWQEPALLPAYDTDEEPRT